MVLASQTPPKIRRTARRCPGVSDQCVGYTAGNTCRIYLRGGPGNPHSSIFSLLLGPCWPYFSLLGASWAHFAPLAVFVVALGWFFAASGRSVPDFGSSGSLPEAFGHGFEGPEPLFFDVFSCTRACKRLCSTKTAHVRKTIIFITAENPCMLLPTIIFSPSGAAVCAQHIRRLPKGEPSVPDIYSKFCPTACL